MRLPLEITPEQDRARIKAERYSSGKTPHTVFTWWARRPFAAMESAIEAAVSNVLDSRGNTKQESIVVVDLFSGGGTIPIAAATLGYKAIAVENNELAAFINNALLTQSQVQPLSRLISRYGKHLLMRLKEETELLFPRRANRTVAYFWSRTLRCPNCSALLNLQKRPWLKKRKGSTVSIKRVPDLNSRRFDVTLSDKPELETQYSSWHSNGSLSCRFCNSELDKQLLQSLWPTNSVDELTAYCARTDKGKTYEAAQPDGSVELLDAAARRILAELHLLSANLPDSPLPKWSGIVNPSLYGFDTYADLLNPRQQAVMLILCRLLREEHAEILTLEGVGVADAVIAMLSSFVDQLADWNSRLCMWIPQNEQVGRGLSGPGIPMMWDYVEIDPLADGPANLWEKLKRVISGVNAIPRFQKLPEVFNLDARSSRLAGYGVDVVAIDPPYYDNIFYSVLADVIYVWKRIALAEIFPKSFSDPMTNTSRELTAASRRHGGRKAAHTFYAEGMSSALIEATRILRQDGVLAFVFAHASSDGWASLLQALETSGFAFFAMTELQAERKRPRSMTSKAIDTSFVFFGRVACTRHFASVEQARDLLKKELGHEKIRDGSFAVDHHAAMGLFGKLFCKASQLEIRDFDGTKKSAREVVSIIEAVLATECNIPALAVRK